MPILFSAIRETISHRPGVYFFLDAKGYILYIGKAANLHARLSSYFLKSTFLETAKQDMLRKAEHITWHETDTEIEALLLETALIKKHLPPYNIVMRDDKQYLFVCFTKEQFPRVVFTHQPVSLVARNLKHETQEKRKERSIEYMGPFTESGAIKKLLRSLRKVFPYCTCKTNHNRICQHGELGLCMKICCQKNYTAAKEEQTTYARNIHFLKNVLQGKQKQLLGQFRIQMNRTSKRREFETAAHLRNYVYALEHVFSHQAPLKKDYISENQKGLHELRLLLKLSAYPTRIEGYDISNIQGAHAVGSMVVFTDGIADKNAYRKFRIRTVRCANDTAMLREVLLRRLGHTEWPLPDIMLIDGGRGQLNAALIAARSLHNESVKKIRIVSIAKREEELYIPEHKTPFKLKEMPTALLYLIQQIRNEAHRFAISYYRKRHRVDFVK